MRKFLFLITAFISGYMCISGAIMLFDCSWGRFYFAMVEIHRVIGLICFLFMFAYIVTFLIQIKRPWLAVWALLALLSQVTRVFFHAFDFLTIPFCTLITLLIPIRLRRSSWRYHTDYPVIKILLVLFYFILFNFASNMGNNPFSPFFFKMHSYIGIICTALSIIVLFFVILKPFFTRYIPDYFRKIQWVFIGIIMIYISISLLFAYKKNIHFRDDVDPSKPWVYSTWEYGQTRPADNRPLEERFINNSFTCRDCHPEITDQWQGSTHRYSVQNRFYQKVVKLFCREKGYEKARFCANCHDPSTVLSDKFDQRYGSGRINNPEGVSCKACHIISWVDTSRGNGIYRVAKEIPYPYPEDPEDKKTNELHKKMIVLDHRPHRISFRRKRLYKSSEYCISCHLVTLDSSIINRPEIHLHTLFNQWEGSEWRETLSCAECHMPTFQMDSHGYPFFDHRILGSNLALSILAMNPSEEDLSLIRDLEMFTERYLKGDLLPGSYDIVYDPSTYTFIKNPWGGINNIMTATVYGRGGQRYKDTEGFLRSGPILDLKVNLDVVRSDGDVLLRVTARTKNVRVGHNFPSGPLDVNQGWMEVIVKDGGDRKIYHSGFLDENHYLDPDAHILGCKRALDESGKEIKHHRFWRITRLEGKRIIKANETIRDVFEIPLPPATYNPLSVSVAWKYRRAKQQIADWLFDQDGTTFPIIEITHVEKLLELPLNLSNNPDPVSYSSDTTASR